MVSLRSWDFPKLSTSKWSTLKGRISKTVVPIANSFGDIIVVYHKSVPVVLHANPSTVGTPYLAIPCAQSQAKNEAFRGVSGPTPADPVICGIVPVVEKCLCSLCS